MFTGPFLTRDDAICGAELSYAAPWLKCSLNANVLPYPRISLIIPSAPGRKLLWSNIQ